MTKDDSIRVDEDPNQRPVVRRRLSRELWWLFGGLMAGFLVLPMVIYGMGQITLGAYGGGPHVGSFIGDLYRSLAAGSLASWSIVLGPIVLIELIRLILRNPSKPAPEVVAQTNADEQRREPFVSS